MLMQIDTPRLTIIPLNYMQLQLYVKADGLLEVELGLEPKPRLIPSDLAEAFEQDIFFAQIVGEMWFYYL
ncbi:hypothetical protein CYCD_27000 [Tenuifilaceae bacterium CYCD]|nr:hypothetical protein CYCD_27000 [Tenuifilaceae bacterium CYCD]